MLSKKSLLKTGLTGSLKIHDTSQNSWGGFPKWHRDVCGEDECEGVVLSNKYLVVDNAVINFRHSQHFPKLKERIFKQQMAFSCWHQLSELTILLQNERTSFILPKERPFNRNIQKPGYGQQMIQSYTRLPTKIATNSPTSKGTLSVWNKCLTRRKPRSFNFSLFKVLKI